MANNKKRQDSNQVTEDDLSILDQLGIDTTPQKKDNLSTKEQRIIAGFEEIQRFINEHGRTPQHGEELDIFERLYATRLDTISRSSECRDLIHQLKLDPDGVLTLFSDKKKALPEAVSDSELLAALGVDTTTDDDITTLKHVKSTREKKSAEEIAQRDRCKEFSHFKPLFEQVQLEIQAAKRETRNYSGYKEIKQGDYFILDGLKCYIAEMAEVFINENNFKDARLRVIFDNGTESNLLMRSLQRALNKDDASRLITAPSHGPLFSEAEDETDIASGTIYILRSQSDHPFIAENRHIIHKIGVTSGDVKKRIANAKKEPTYLLADVEIVQSYKLSNINPRKLESLLHQFFSNARLELVFNDRFGNKVEPREWFLVPLPAIEHAIEKLLEGQLHDFHYDSDLAVITPP